MAGEPRTAKLVIDQAIRENRFPERLCYCIVVVVVLIGAGVLVTGAVRGEGLVALAGAVATSLFWPALAQARGIRDKNIAIRLLEISLERSATAEEAARALQEAFTHLFVTRQP